MKLAEVDLKDALDGVLIHNVADAQGHKALNKGQRLTESDLEKLRALNQTRVLIGVFEAGDIGENEAATRVATAVAGSNITLSAVSGGRINLLAATRGILKVDDDGLTRINSLDGVTLATIQGNSIVTPNMMVATVKTIGLAIADLVLRRVEVAASEAGRVISISPLRQARVAVILTGSEEARGRIDRTFTPAIQGRVEDLGASVVFSAYVEHQAPAIAGAIEHARSAGIDCLILAGETSIMDERDVTPSGITRAGGTIEVYGAPVEPGNLLLLAYWDGLPIIGAPGCVKSRDTNVVDLILPRLLAGEHIGKADIVALANGGLLI